MHTENGEGPTVCRSVAAAMLLAADDELSRAEWLVVEQHLDQCAACRTQWATFALTDRRLLECTAELSALSPLDSAVRNRLIAALSERERRGWLGWFWRPPKWRWAGVSMATLSLLAMSAWILLTPLNMETRRLERSGIGSPSSATGDAASGSEEVVRVQLSLVPVGDPFLDGSQSESVLANVTVGSDGQPTDFRLAK